MIQVEFVKCNAISSGLHLFPATLCCEILDFPIAACCTDRISFGNNFTALKWILYLRNCWTLLLAIGLFIELGNILAGISAWLWTCFLFDSSWVFERWSFSNWISTLLSFIFRNLYSLSGWMAILKLKAPNWRGLHTQYGCCRRMPISYPFSPHPQPLSQSIDNIGIQPHSSRAQHTQIRFRSATREYRYQWECRFFFLLISIFSGWLLIFNAFGVIDGGVCLCRRLWIDPYRIQKEIRKRKETN